MERIEEHRPFLKSLILLNQSKVIVEIGVAEAVTTDFLCQGAAYTGGFVYGYDSWGVHGVSNQFQPWSSLEKCQEYLRAAGHTNFELMKINSKTPEFHNMIRIKHPVIDLAFVDGCHSYEGIKNDFDAVYPQLSETGIVVFHDTLRIDGCREFMIDLRTKFWDGTFDMVDFPFGWCGGRDRRTGVSMLVKRSFATLQLGIDEQCNIDNKFEEIYQKEQDWLQSELDNVESNT